MFEATYVGHHCWLFSTEQTRILVDPLLHGAFGFTAANGLNVYPPRKLKLDAFPSLHAVLLTHEHEGHFDIASLNCLDRRIPIYISARSSSALRRFLAEMGFTVSLLHPGQELTVGDLVLHPITPDQTESIIEEWDVFHYLVRDTNGDGSFFTPVDMSESDRVIPEAQKLVETPGLWAHTNNDSSWQFTSAWLPTDRTMLRKRVMDVVSFQGELEERWALPQAVLVTGGGFSFGPERAWINRNAFLYGNDTIAEAAGKLLPEAKVLAPVPGQCLRMEGGKLAGITKGSPFLDTVPRTEWPPRQFEGDIDWIQDYDPVCGKKDFPEEDLEALVRELDGFAGHLYASDFFKRQYSLNEEDRKGREPTLAFSLLADSEGGAYTFAYEPQGCRFVPREVADPEAAFLGVYECWASDLLAFFRAEISVVSLSFGRSRQWNANPLAVPNNVNTILFEYVHPLRHPERFLELYRRVLAGLPEDVTRIHCAQT